MRLPEWEEFRRAIYELRNDERIRSVMLGDVVRLRDLSVADIQGLMRSEAGDYFFRAAAGFNRTTLNAALKDPEIRVGQQQQRRALAVRQRLPMRESFASIATKAVAAREADFQRKERGGIEEIFRQRLIEEAIPLYMSPPRRVIPGVVVRDRKPDGVWPDPASGQRPRLYLEIKNIRRVRDDIQKRLYELAEVSLEMKLLYGSSTLAGLGLAPGEVRDGAAIERLKAQIRASNPVVVGLLICPQEEAERYRQGAEALIDRIFFQEEVENASSSFARLSPTRAVTQCRARDYSSARRRATAVAAPEGASRRTTTAEL